mmetsp:Transcript_20540/g.65561  ORF Transcript_20540/g.65561 Transcript_20540/m.65561 type:complete len:212 (-) Transcript_20540:323-958(-)
MRSATCSPWTSSAQCVPRRGFARRCAQPWSTRLRVPLAATSWTSRLTLTASARFRWRGIRLRCSPWPSRPASACSGRLSHSWSTPKTSPRHVQASFTWSSASRSRCACTRPCSSCSRAWLLLTRPSAANQFRRARSSRRPSTLHTGPMTTGARARSGSIQRAGRRSSRPQRTRFRARGDRAVRSSFRSTLARTNAPAGSLSILRCSAPWRR